MAHPGGAPKGSQNNLKHGLNFAKRALTRYGSRVIDQRTHFARELAKWRRGLVQDLGGDISTQQEALVDLCCKSKLLLDSVDAWLLVQKSIINKRNRCLYPVVRERQALADGLARYLAQLGLERRVKTKTLDEILNEDENEQEEPRDEPK